MTDRPYHFVAIVGGAIAGSVAAEILADQGIRVVVIEQNERPYGKIEDGLPRWHREQRKQEYGRIDARLKRPGVFFLPSTKLGRDIDFQDLCDNWGFSAVLLANGAWRDRELGIAGAEKIHRQRSGLPEFLYPLVQTTRTKSATPARITKLLTRRWS